MIFGWFRRRRRRKILSAPFPEPWLACLDRNVWHYALLSEDERRKLRDDLRIFVAEKNWEGCGGLVLIDEIRVTIAAQIALLVLGLDHDYFSSVKSILVYPAAYAVPVQARGSLIVGEVDARLGEAWYRGPVILSWDAALAGGRGRARGQNLVLHEFAHQIDMQDRDVDGTPPLKDLAQLQQWQAVMADEFEELHRISRRGGRSLLDQYGVTSEAEFFSVATECFFERSRAMRLKHRRLYDTLRLYYGQDPAARLDRRQPAGSASEHEDEAPADSD